MIIHFVPLNVRLQKISFQKLFLATLIPILAALLQWRLWPILTPKTWIFLYPAVFFSASIGGFAGGAIATCLSALLGVYFFTEPPFTWVIGDVKNYTSLLVFLTMGLLFSLTFDRYFKATKELQRINALELETQQNRLKIVLDAVHAGIWEWNVTTNQNFWTDNLWELYGLEPQSREPSYEAWFSAVHPDDRTQVEELINSAVKSRGELNLEWRVAQSVDSQERWLMARGRPVLNEQDEVALYRGIVLDVSERKAIIKQLQEDEAWLNFAMETLKAGIWWLSLDSLNAKRTLLHDQIFGYPTLLPNWTYDLFLEHVILEDRQSVDKTFREARANLIDWAFECRIRRKDNDIRWILAKGSHKFDPSGRAVALVGIVQDITELKRSTESALENATRIQAILDTAADGIITIDKRGIIRTFNPAAETMFGYSAAEVIGSNINLLMPEPYRSQHANYLENYLATGEAKIIGVGRTVEGLRKNGSVFPMDLAVNEARLREEIIFTGIVRDITDRENAQNELKAALNEKETLLREVYHRVKNNLQIISSLISLQARNIKNDEALLQLRQTADRVKTMALIHEKLYQSKDLAKIDFNDYVRNLIDHLLFSFGVQDRHIEINTQIDSILLDVDTAIPCGLIINELVSNALEHAFPQSRQGQIDISFTRDRNQFVLVIADNGIGLPKGMDINKCASLGLQLVNRLITDQLKGHLRQSENYGASFIIQFNHDRLKKN